MYTKDAVKGLNLIYFEILQRSGPTKTKVELLGLLIECTQGNLTF